MKRLLADLRHESPPVKCAWLGMMLAGTAGAILGLIVGLHVHAATAWFAMIELGVPAAIAGGLIGLLTGWIIAIVNDAEQDHQA
jgi:hypothetical protein